MGNLTDAEPKRVVSLIASATKIICALGARDLLVGRSHECDFPPEVTLAAPEGAEVPGDRRKLRDRRPRHSHLAEGHSGRNRKLSTAADNDLDWFCERPTAALISHECLTGQPWGIWAGS